MTETVTRYVPPRDPWALPSLDDSEILALKALVSGTASAFQQQLAIKVITVKLAATFDMAFRPGGKAGERATTFAEGKQFVGQRIMAAVETPMKTKVTGEKDAPTGKASPRPEQAARKNRKPISDRSKPAKAE